MYSVSLRWESHAFPEAIRAFRDDVSTQGLVSHHKWGMSKPTPTNPGGQEVIQLKKHHPFNNSGMLLCPPVPEIALSLSLSLSLSLTLTDTQAQTAYYAQ